MPHDNTALTRAAKTHRGPLARSCRAECKAMQPGLGASAKRTGPAKTGSEAWLLHKPSP